MSNLMNMLLLTHLVTGGILLGAATSSAKSLTSSDAPITIGVTNGRGWGDWGPLDRCPLGSKAVGFRLKYESDQRDGDDTALNAISLLCDDEAETWISSSIGEWGEWSSTLKCPGGAHLVSFKLRVDYLPLNIGDDKAATNIAFQCSNGAKLEGDGHQKWGQWGYWSERCRNSAICGIQTRVESNQGTGDDTALNDVQFACCT